MKKYLLGIDVGTTGTKSVLFGEDGEIAGSSYRAYPALNSAGGISEQNAEDWWTAICETVGKICADEEKKNVVSISLSTQGGTIVPTDKNFRPLRNAILWSDTRCAAIAEKFRKEVGDCEYLYRKTGWKLVRGLPVLSIRWIRENEPEIFGKAAYFLSVPDFVAAKMTGIPKIDLSNAGIDELTNITSGKYDPELLSFVGLTEDRLPEIVRSGDLIGKLTDNAAKELGINPGAVLCAGAHDQYAVALGAGTSGGGDVLVGSGTSWAVTTLSDRECFDTGMRTSAAAVPGKWGALSSISYGGVCLDWLRKEMMPGLPYKDIDRESAEVKAAEDGLFFIPFGTVRDFGDDAQEIPGGFIGLNTSFGKFSLSRAVMEGVSFEAVRMVRSLGEIKSGSIKLAGGASKGPLWPSLIADISGMKVTVPGLPDLACLGAAVMAGVGCGLYPDWNAAYEALAVEDKTVYPNEERVAIYKPLFEKYCEYIDMLAKETEGK